MSVLFILLGAGAFLILGGRLYAPVIARVLGERDDRPTPATTRDDGRDYVPTRTPVVFAHHFASIAGAGPILGPILAIYYGWGPALAWILVGGLLLGAVHDYVSTHIALREGGKNLAVVVRRYVGRAAFLLMLLLLVALLVLVCAAFLDASARALTSRVPADVLGLGADSGLIRVQDGNAIIGGIASTSVIVITAFSPLLGWLYLKRRASIALCSAAAVGICAASIVVGLYLPMNVSPETWKYLIAGYVLVSAGLPVWLFLQSRDFINVHLLYAGMGFLLVALIAAAFRGGGHVSADAIPFMNWNDASARLGPGWPVLFVTIACGAVSGFHSLCAGGTTCKQLRTERAARHVGFYGMLLESFLATCVVGCVIVGLSLASYETYRAPGVAGGNAILTFAMAVGHTANIGLGVPIVVGAIGAMLLLEGFLVTTLDTAIRLTRYLIEEGWATIFGRYDVFADHAAVQAPDDDRHADELTGTGGLPARKGDLAFARDLTPRPLNPIATTGLRRALLRALRQYWVNSALAVVLTLLIAQAGYERVWSIFGSSNQLLAALTLFVATGWLAAHRRVVWYTLLPALFMLATSVTMIVRLLAFDYLPDLPAKLPLAIAAILILAITAALLGMLAYRQFDPRASSSSQPA